MTSKRSGIMKLQLNLFSSPDDFPVNRSVVPGSNEAQKITDISGRKCFESYQKQNPNGLLVKMSEGLLVTTTAWFSRIVVLTWKEKVTPFKRLLFQLAPSVRHTEGIGCGLLGKEQNQVNQSKQQVLNVANTNSLIPTPDCSDRRSMKSKQQGLSNKIAMLPTPIAGDWKGQLRSDGTASMLSGKIALLPTPKSQNANQPSIHGQGGKDLRTTISMCPTPRANDWKGASKQTENKGRNPMTNSCMDAVENGINRGLKLHPDFVSWMMNYPLDWLDI